MRIPVIRGMIKRRLLVNFRADPEVVQRILPEPFKPKLHAGHAIGGVCLIRLEKIRPAGLPEIVGLSSENAAHRIAVQWQGDQRPAPRAPDDDLPPFPTWKAMKICECAPLPLWPRCG